jgi:Ca2+-binding RTX toxin-like protein
MAITFGSNTTVNGTNGADTMVGVDLAGNTNDIVYGHQGDDSIGSPTGFSNSTIFGGQGNDTIRQQNVSAVNIPTGHNAIYGNLGNDVIYSVGAEGDTIYGGQGDDNLFGFMSSGGTIYGNQGNDSIGGHGTQMKFFGGQGNDTINDAVSNLDAIYGNQGDDLLFGVSISNSHEYGGQGNDTLVFTGTPFGTTNDVETGGLGNDLFIATNDAGGGPLNASDIVTVTDFLQGFDKLSETSSPTVGFVKLAGTGDSAAQALALADSFYASFSGSGYAFVYGGVGAGYLFYNGDSGGSVALSGMAITGATSETSVNFTDITAFKPGLA